MNPSFEKSIPESSDIISFVENINMTINLSHSHLNANSKWSDIFIALSEHLCFLLKEEGISFSPYADKANLRFSQLKEEDQILQMIHFEKYVEVCQETRNQGYSLKESRYLLWNMIRKLGLIPADDLFNKIDDVQVFEIYNKNNVQIFRNINFFTICSYTIDDLLSVPWWQLYRRDEQISRDLFYQASSVLSGEIKSAFSPTIPPHFLEEVESSAKHKMLLEVKLMAPLRDAIDSVFYFVAEEAQLFAN